MCNKKKVDRIKALMIIANANKENSDHKRREKRLYWCESCKSYHTTSKK